MKAVVDTNVIAYALLLTEPYFEECDRFLKEVEDPIAPASWQAELTNVLWLAVRGKILPIADALNRLNFVGSMRIRSIAVDELWHDALILSDTFGLAAYDTLFVALAARESLPLATFDKDIIKAFPSLAMHPHKLTTP